jgi:cobalt-zinc-cadmium efflux system outer membrane protein
MHDLSGTSVRIRATKSLQASPSRSASFGTLVVPYLGMAILGLATGCASVKPDQRFPEVQRDVAQRLARRVIWDRGGPEGDTVRIATAKLLDQPLDVSTAVQVTLLNSNSLQATFEDLGVAQADLVQAGLLPNPNFDGFVRWFDISPSGPNWNLGLHLPLQMFLIPLRTKLAGVALDEAVLRVTGEVLKQAADTRTAFYALQADEQIGKARKTVADLADVAAELAERQYKVGNIDDLTLANERAARQQANIASITADSSARTSRENLRRLMGLSGSNVKWRVETEAPLPPETVFVETELVDLAISSSLEVATARKLVQREEYALELKHDWWLETASVGVETERASAGGYQTGPDFSVELPIFDQKQAVFARQAAQIRQARRRLANTEDGVRQEVRTALDRMNTAAQISRYYASEVVPLRQQMSVMTEKRYQGMLVGVFELLTAKSEEADATSAAVRARQDFWNAASDLELALGGRVPLSSHSQSPPTTAPVTDTAPQSPATQPAPSMPGMPGM